MSQTVVLEARGLTRSFTGVVALNNVDFRLRAGEIHALMGQNGAGKSTLIKVLTGVYPADRGELRLGGEVVVPTSPAAAQALGISTVYQEVNLCPNLSVAENIFAGRYPRRGAAGLWRIDWPRMQADARTLLARLHLEIDVTRLLSSYSVAVQQMVAIARALGVQARVLILDEPTSSLDEEEVQRLFGVMRKLRDEGMAILFVTHFFEQMYAVSDRITVLRNGELVGEYLKADLPPAALIQAMVGRELSAAAGKSARAASDVAAQTPLLQATALGRRGQLKPIDLDLHRGEVVGVGGLLGSGRTELARLLFGLDKSDSGELRIAGQAVKFDNPAQAIRQGLAMCPEERKVEGIVAELSVRENIVLALQARLGIWRYMSHAQQTQIAERFVKTLGIKTADLDTPIAQLSGGNQQKVVLGRWLATEPQLLILDEPTRGIDVAAKQEIMNEILALANAGLAVLFISSEMEEVVRVSDRIVVLRDRAKVGELPGNSSEQAVYHLIAATT
ncbi:sugar ABC transporter ATP-binding protein [soil metagenome]